MSIAEWKTFGIYAAIVLGISTFVNNGIAKTIIGVTAFVLFLNNAHKLPKVG